MKCITCKEREAVTGTKQCKKCWRRDYRKRNKAHIRKVSHARYERNRELIREKAKDKYHENPKHFLEMAKKTRQKNRDKLNKRRNIVNAIRYRQHYCIREQTRRAFSHLLAGASCEECCSKEKLVFHHPTEPYQYDVFQILCERCHGAVHGKHNFLNGTEVKR